MEDKKTGRFTFRTTPQDEEILTFVKFIDDEENGSKIIRRLLLEYAVKHGYLMRKYSIDPAAYYDR